MNNKPTDGYHAGPNNLKLALNIVCEWFRCCTTPQSKDETL